jgi:hypothetical protein
MHNRTQIIAPVRHIALVTSASAEIAIAVSDGMAGYSLTRRSPLAAPAQTTYVTKPPKTGMGKAATKGLMRQRSRSIALWVLLLASLSALAQSHYPKLIDVHAHYNGDMGTKQGMWADEEIFKRIVQSRGSARSTASVALISL